MNNTDRTVKILASILFVFAILCGVFFAIPGPLFSVVTKANFDRIQIGMKKNDLEEIIGSDSEYAEAQRHVWRGPNGEAQIDFNTAPDGHYRVVEKRWVPNK